MNTPTFYGLFRSYSLCVSSVQTLTSTLALSLALAEVRVLLLGWDIGLDINNFAMHFDWVVLLATIPLVALFLGAAPLRTETIWLALLFAPPPLTNLTGCLALVGTGPE